MHSSLKLCCISGMEKFRFKAYNQLWCMLRFLRLSYYSFLSFAVKLGKKTHSAITTISCYVSRTYSGKDRKRNNESASSLPWVYHCCNLKENPPYGYTLRSIRRRLRCKFKSIISCLQLNKYNRLYKDHDVPLSKAFDLRLLTRCPVAAGINSMRFA